MSLLQYNNPRWALVIAVPWMLARGNSKTSLLKAVFFFNHFGRIYLQFKLMVKRKKMFVEKFQQGIKTENLY
jgi:hypothetical protein